MSQEAGHPNQFPQCRYQNIIPLSTAHWVCTQGDWSTPSTHYHHFCPFNSSSSRFNSCRNCFEPLTQSCTPLQDKPDPIPCAGLVLTSPAQLHSCIKVETSAPRGSSCPSLSRASSWIDEVGSAPSQPVVRMQLTIPRNRHCALSFTSYDIRVRLISVLEVLTAIPGGRGTDDLKSYLTDTFRSWDFMKTKQCFTFITPQLPV